MTGIQAAERRGFCSRRWVLHWGGDHTPLPQQRVRLAARNGDSSQPRQPSAEPLDFSEHLRRLCDDISVRCAEFAHVRTEQILIGFTQARNGRAHGLQARVTPMRFHHGSQVKSIRGRHYQVQQFYSDGIEVLYLMTFCLPRFLNQPFADKMVTIFHELYHISPQFDGDLRRHAGRYCVHSHSQSGYDRHMARLAQKYLDTRPDPGLHEFLRLDFSQLRQKHGHVFGIVVPRPKLLPLDSEPF